LGVLSHAEAQGARFSKRGFGGPVIVTHNGDTKR
jgi:hypothetical protein